MNQVMNPEVQIYNPVHEAEAAQFAAEIDTYEAQAREEQQARDAIVAHLNPQVMEFYYQMLRTGNVELANQVMQANIIGAAATAYVEAEAAYHNQQLILNEEERDKDEKKADA